MRLDDWLSQARERLAKAQVDNPLLEAQLLAGHALSVDRAYVLAHPEVEVPPEAGEDLLRKRERREPLAYILGYREFFGRKFRVSPAVLIPRHETETLVETALQDLGKGAAKILDLGTGSGCIGITIKLEHPECEVIACDVSQESLDVAAANAEELGADVRFVRSDGFENLGNQVFDLILTNPPYVGQGESLPPEVRDHEPKAALYAGEKGLDFYEMLTRKAADHLDTYGRLIMEVGYTQSDAVVGMFEAQGWTLSGIRKDLSGTDRVVIVEPVTV